MIGEDQRVLQNLKKNQEFGFYVIVLFTSTPPPHTPQREEIINHERPVSFSKIIITLIKTKPLVIADLPFSFLALHLSLISSVGAL